ncbi:arginine-ornithine antiporter [Mobilicoccus massiliensis]|uniref:arginine-ornithine antiporter n=1 Tax=Mobilicoccus massiliensis TaxID=1522310 RepID=UPI0006937C3F|nr:arginine-ornithine antiporter [Mobilicoccus massiliensis]
MATISDRLVPGANEGSAGSAVQRPGGLPLAALTALAIGSMIGAGIFNIPSDMASAAAPGPVLIGWTITGVGMLMLALTFQTLSTARPEVDGGVYGYARAGFGDFIGYTSAWGYWISAWVGNVAFFVMAFGTLGNFFPIFREVEGVGGSFGPTPASIVGASVLLWCYHLLILRGVKEAAILNTVVTIAKIVPIVLFVVLAVVAFDLGIFTADFWGRTVTLDGEPLGSTIDQVKNMMMVTVWVFIGIEGASIFSSRAQKRSDVGKATVVGFLAVLALLVLVNLVSYGVMAQADVAGLSKPSMAAVLSSVVGPWGTWFISIGLIVSILGALLSWTLLCAEILLKPAQEGVMPRWLAKENKNGAPVNALWMTSLCIQAMLVWTLVNAGTYNTLIYLASALVLLPYFWSVTYAVVTALRDGGSGDRHIGLGALVIALVAVVYAVWLVYAAELQYLLLACIFYVVGAGLYVWARREARLPVFRPYEMAIAAIVVVAAAAGVVGLATGAIQI